MHYSVWWRRKDAGEEWRNVTTAGPKHVVHNTGTYVPYEIKIQARNEFGQGPESNVVTGYSGEDSEYCRAVGESQWEVDSLKKAGRYFVLKLFRMTQLLQYHC